MLIRLHIFLFLVLPNAFLIDEGNWNVLRSCGNTENKLVNSTVSTFKQTPKIIKENSSTEKTLTYEVVFAMNKSYLSMALKEKLDRIYKVYTTNHTDTLNIISKTPGDKLYKERSINVTNYLISKGVPSSHIRYIDFGKFKTGNGIEIIIKE